METVEGILALKDAVAVGHIVEAKFQGGEWTLGEVMNVSQSDGRLYYYIHYLSKDKKEDDWVCHSDVRINFDLSSLRARLEPPSQDRNLPGPVWGGFSTCPNYPNRQRPGRVHMGHRLRVLITTLTNFLPKQLSASISELRACARGTDRRIRRNIGLWTDF